MENIKYIAHYTTPKGLHRSKCYSTLEEAMSHKGRVWCVTFQQEIFGVLHSNAIYVNMSNYWF